MASLQMDKPPGWAVGRVQAHCAEAQFSLASGRRGAALDVS